jgi:gamma-glutamylcyclotransferase (GGCT)/AIG2-like uncharacterized protein YtfP
VWGEVFRMEDPEAVLAVLDAIEGCEPSDPDRSLYNRAVTGVRVEDGSTEQAWAYFYNAPLGQASRIDSGDYLRHVTVR